MTNSRVVLKKKNIGKIVCGSGGIIDPDDLFDELIRTAKHTKKLVIEGLWQMGVTGLRVISEFLFRYRIFIKRAKVNGNSESGVVTIELNQLIPVKGTNGYSEIENDYTASYYMNDCGGFGSFIASHGHIIDPRLQNVNFLVAPCESDRILDIGSGRGELSFTMSLNGAAVTGVDYSKDAIDIAVGTYGNSNPRLRFIRSDVFKLSDFGSYNKYVMADVVEHIEQDMLERLFLKISEAMNPESDDNNTDRKVLVIHTAPNKHYYDDYYPLIRQKAFEASTWLPRDPRSYYDHRVHINEQTPEGLKEALDKYFPNVMVWTGSVADYYTLKSDMESMRDNEIFAIASVSDTALSEIKKSLSILHVFPERQKTSVKIRLSKGLTLPTDSEGRPIFEVNNNVGSKHLEIEIENTGSEVISSLKKNPNNISYHIQDMNGEMVVFDGMRTRIPGILYPEESVHLQIEITGLKQLKTDSDYILTIAMVTEKAFWSDDSTEECLMLLLKVGHSLA